MNEIRKNFENLARLAPEYVRESRDADMITELANKYCEAFDAGDEDKKNIYISALMLKFWDQAQAIYNKVKATGLEYDDCVSQLYKCISAAMEYRAWQDGSTTAKACINQVIASRGAPEIIYEYNRDTKKANVNTERLDAPIGTDGEESVSKIDLVAGDDDPAADLNVELLVQGCIDKNRIVEAIIMDILAFADCEKETKETKTSTYFDENGEIKEYEYTITHKTPWNYKLVRNLNSLDDSYINYFYNRYDVQLPILQAGVKSIQKGNNQKLYKFIEATKTYLKNNLSL